MAKNLTDTFVRNVKGDPAKRVEHKDGQVEGLYLVVQPSGSKSWAWRYKHPATKKPDKITLGAYPAYGLEEAREWARDNSKLKARGIDPKEERRRAEAERERVATAKAKDDEQTLAWFWDTIYEPTHIQGLKDPNGEYRMWNNILKPHFGETALTEIEHDDFAHMIDEVKADAPYTANRVVSMLKTMYKRMLTQHRHIVVNRTNAAQYLVAPTEEQARERTLDRQELGYALAVIEEFASRDDKSNHCTFGRAMRLIVGTGCRRDEAFESEWAHFDLPAGSWFQPGKMTKNSVPNLLYLPEPILVMLRKMRVGAPEDRFVFRQRKVDKPLNAFSKSMAAVLEATKKLAARDGREMEGWSAHDLRRTLSTELRGIREPGSIRSAVPPEVVEAILNHVEGAGREGVAKVYNKYRYVEEKQLALGIWQDFLDAALAEERERQKRRSRMAA